MRFILCAVAVILPILVYPAIVPINSELIPVFNYLEIDFFNWYRMLFLGLIAPAGVLSVRPRNLLFLCYLGLLLLSTLASRFPETSIYGSPMHHEGLITILGYIGMFELSRRCGFFPALQKCLSFAIYFTAAIAALQLVYGNFLDFPMIRPLISPLLQMRAMDFPLYGNMGNPNHLGLFCALLLPYTVFRKKRVETIILIALLFGSMSRAALLSLTLVLGAVRPRYLIAMGIIAGILLIPKQGTISRQGFMRDSLSRSIRDIHFPPRDSDLGGRAYMWKRAIPVLKESIILGKGPATYVHYVPQFTPRQNLIGFASSAIDRPHNMYINIWESSGLLSLILLGIFVMRILYWSKDFGMALGVISYLITGLFTDSVLCVTPYFAIFLGVLANEYNEAR